MGKFGNSDSLRLRPVLPPRVAVRLGAALARLWCHPGTADVSRLLVSSSDNSVLGEADREVGGEGRPKRKRNEGKMNDAKLDADFRKNSLANTGLNCSPSEQPSAVL